MVAELRPGLARRRHEVGGDAGRGAGAVLGGEHGDARPLAARLRAGDQPADPELGRASSSATYSTPYIAIAIAAVLALALAIPGDIRFLARVYAFGALLAVTIAQISIVRLRVVEPDLERPYRVPLQRQDRLARAAAAGDRRGGDQRARLDQRVRAAPHGGLRRRRLDAVRARLLRDLPALRGGDAADHSGFRCRRPR